MYNYYYNLKNLIILKKKDQVHLMKNHFLKEKMILYKWLKQIGIFKI